MGKNLSKEVPNFTLSRKAFRRSNYPAVPRTDTGSEERNPKVSERTLVKKLGKMTP